MADHKQQISYKKDNRKQKNIEKYINRESFFAFK